MAGGVSSFPPVFSFLGVEGWALRRGEGEEGEGCQRRMLILIETVEHLPRPVGETTPPEDIVSNEYANHERAGAGVRGPL